MSYDINPTIALPTDHELHLLTDYLGGFMSEGEIQKFDRRLEEDEEFFLRMLPMLDFWYSEKLLPAEVETLRAIQARRPLIVTTSETTDAKSSIRRAALRLMAKWWPGVSLMAASLAWGIARLAMSPAVEPAYQLVVAEAPSIAPLGGNTAVSTAAPRLTPPGVTQPITDIVNPTVIADAADSVVAKGSLARTRTADARVEADVEFKSNVDVATQWAQPEGERGLVGSVVHAVGEKLSEIWGKVRHAGGTHKPTGAPPPL